MPYDPQRQHQRHRVSGDDGPAPVDVLLKPSPAELPVVEPPVVERRRSGRQLVRVALVIVVVLVFLAARRATSARAKRNVDARG